MNGLIRASLRNPYAVTVFCLTLVMLGGVSVYMIPIDILPVFKSPAVQVLTFYCGMPAASIEKDITNRMERWTGQASGTARQESRSIVGASIVRNYFRSGTDPNGGLDAGQLAGHGGDPQPAAGDAPAGRPAVRPDEHDAGLHRRRRQPRRVAERVDPLRRGAVRGPQHAHEPPGGDHAGRLRRQDPRRDGLPRPPEAPGPGALAARRDERDGPVQRLPADRRRQDRRHRLRPRLELDVRLPQADGGHPARTRRSATSPTSATWRRPGHRRSSRPTWSGSTARRRSTSPSSGSSGRAPWPSSTASATTSRSSPNGSPGAGSS